LLRVGLTGGLGSGKSTVAAMLAARGAHVFYADEIGREMMRPGEPVYSAIVEHFGPEVVQASGELDRAALARIAFGQRRVEELNSIVHPAVIAKQAELAERVFERDVFAVVVVESALVFETKHGGPEGWRSRFDSVVLVTASEETRMVRFVQRAGGGSPSAEVRKELLAEARRRMSEQISEEEKIAASDFVLRNDGSPEDLEVQVDELWPVLRFASEQKALARLNPPPPDTIKS
jgi:dephospho-CoA kinase